MGFMNNNLFSRVNLAFLVFLDCLDLQGPQMDLQGQQLDLQVDQSDPTHQLKEKRFLNA